MKERIEKNHEYMTWDSRLTMRALSNELNISKEVGTQVVAYWNKIQDTEAIKKAVTSTLKIILKEEFKSCFETHTTEHICALRLVGVTFK